VYAEASVPPRREWYRRLGHPVVEESNEFLMSEGGFRSEHFSEARLRNLVGECIIRPLAGIAYLRTFLDPCGVGLGVRGRARQSRVHATRARTNLGFSMFPEGTPRDGPGPSAVPLETPRITSRVRESGPARRQTSRPLLRCLGHDRHPPGRTLLDVG